MQTTPAPLIATALTFLALGGGFGLWAGSVPLFATAAHLTPLKLGGVLLAVAIGAVGAMSLTGRLVAQFGSVRVARGAGIAFAGAFLPLTLATTLPALAPCAALLGAAMGTLDVSMNAMASLLEQARGRPVMSRLHAAFSLGGLGGALLASLLAAHGAEAPALHLAAAALVAALIGAAWHLTRGMPPLRPANPACMPNDAPLPERRLAALGLIAALAMVCEGAIGDWSGMFAMATIAAPHAAAPLSYAAFSVAMVAMRLAGDTLATRLGAPAMMRMGAATAALGLLAAALAASLPRALAGFALTGLGLGTLVPLALSTAGRLGAHASGESGTARALARTTGWGYGGFLTGPPLISLAVQGLGLRGAFGILAATALAMLLLIRQQQDAGPSRSRSVPHPGNPR